MKISRFFDLKNHINPNKALIIYGARRVGKTTLIENFIKNNSDKKIRLENGENFNISNILSSLDFDEIKDFCDGYDIIVIDEAQNIKNIGQALKIMVDNVENIKIIATGSSSFELSGQIGEPLTGRKETLILYPICELELKNHFNKNEQKLLLEDRLLFGFYPDVITAKSKNSKIKILDEITGSYLFRDILALENIKNSKKISDLLRIIAFQVGSEVSHTQLANRLGIDQKTVSKYLDLLEKSFILFNLRGFSRNLSKEVVKKSKYYFYDLGIRNSLIGNFNKIQNRDDIGALFENYVIIERLKKKKYKNIYGNDYFWRTWDKKEVDLIEERDGKLFGYEIKWSKNNISPKQKLSWLETYDNAEYKVITQDNYLDFIS